jgi:glycosyltransferase involved in cell wall biosynthesis
VIAPSTVSFSSGDAAAVSAAAPVGVLHMVDSLHVGGAESVAINLVNHLGSRRYRPFLCTTREEGIGVQNLKPEVGRITLGRRARLDVDAFRQLWRFVKQNNIRIVHAHSTSLFTALAVRAASPSVAVIWHAHSGRKAMEDRPDWRYACAVKAAAGVITASRDIEGWVRRRLGPRQDRVWYLPNVVDLNDAAPAGLPGVKGQRVICVANIRPEKDQDTLVAAFELVVKRAPDAHLILVGETIDHEMERRLRQQIARRGLSGNVSMLGRRSDISALLAACDVGVLSSRHEGLPVGLLEYGAAGLAAVATNVGECSQVLDDGQAGFVVPPGDVAALAEALSALVLSPELRERFELRFRERVSRLHGPKHVAETLRAIYDQILSLPGDGPSSETC